MKLIVGLGNPGEQYKNTPHNAGWHVIDKFAERHNATWQVQTRFQAMMTTVNVGSGNVTLMKPLTFMNLSGNSVSLFAQKNGIEAEDILIISDELAFPVGTARLREGGSHNGHNGLRNVAERIGTNKFPRIRVGIQAGVPVSGENRVEYVLKKMPPKDWENYMCGVEMATDALEYTLKNSFTAAMNRYNVKGKQTQEPKD